jgi:2,5-diamino-6-(ribosylamino)-4(3H)-pyrimidinone 5'-phosphate reductase
MRDTPYVICHMTASIDGKILTRRWDHLSVSDSIGELYDEAAGEYDVGAWLVGTKTMKEFFPSSKKLRTSKKAVPVGDYIAHAQAETLAITTDTNGSLRFNDNEVGGDHIVVITTQKADTAYRAHLREQEISYLICGKEKIDFALALRKLRRVFKLEKLLLEGGGLINGAMLQAGLIDEISQLIVPIVDGGGAGISGLYDLNIKRPKRGAFALRLIEQRTFKNGTVWLRYRVKHGQ